MTEPHTELAQVIRFKAIIFGIPYTFERSLGQGLHKSICVETGMTYEAMHKVAKAT